MSEIVMSPAIKQNLGDFSLQSGSTESPTGYQMHIRKVSEHVHENKQSNRRETTLYNTRRSDEVCDKTLHSKRLKTTTVLVQASKGQNVLPTRLVTVICMGHKPRKVIRVLLSSKTARSFDQFMNTLTEAIKPSCGFVRRLYDLTDGKEIVCLQDFFGGHEVFLASSKDRVAPDDFKLHVEELSEIQRYARNYKPKEALNTIRTHEGKHIALEKKRKVDSNKKLQKRKPSDTFTVCDPEVPLSSRSISVVSEFSSHPKYIPATEFPEFILNTFSVGKIIGYGNFAAVRECTHRVNDQNYALKVIDILKSNQANCDIDCEVRILSKVRHPNIIMFFEKYDFPDCNQVFIVMELIEGGDLYYAIKKVSKFSEDESAVMTRDIASALSYLHTLRIVHRDIKPENLLVFVDELDRLRLKLTDFGLAEYVDGPKYTICGTSNYIAPEILDGSGYGMKVDVWALGVISYILLCGYPPFSHPTDIKGGTVEFDPQDWTDILGDAKDLILKMIEQDVVSRICSTRALEHPWLSTIKNKMSERDISFNVFDPMGLGLLPFRIPEEYDVMMLDAELNTLNLPLEPYL